MANDINSDINVLVVDDEEELCRTIEKVLSRAGYRVRSIQKGRKCIKEVRRELPDVILLDLVLNDTDGLTVLSEIKEIEPELPVIMLTAHETVQTAVEAMKRGAFHYMPKPFDNDDLIAHIQKAWENWRLVREVRFLRERLRLSIAHGELVAASKKMQEVVSAIDIVASTNVTVLITGATGVGKERVAKCIHLGSKRAGGSFVPIDLASCPETLVESELFGYEKGAYTGAYRSTMGKLESARGGTVFLDEIGNLPVGIQAKLLRTIESREVERLGSRKKIQIDVRIIVATNLDLAVETKDGRFREDLFHRLNEYPIYISPLSERSEDIAPLVQNFIEDCREEVGRDVSGISEEALKLLEGYPFPGNVRELRNVVRRCMLVSGKRILPHHLPSEVREFKPTETEEFINSYNLKDAVRTAAEETEKRIIIKTLEKTKGKRGEAAKLLDVDAKTLFNKIKAHRL